MNEKKTLYLHDNRDIMTFQPTTFNINQQMKLPGRFIKSCLMAAVLTLTSNLAFAGIAVLDITERSGDNEISGDYSRQVYSATYMCDIAGYDYIVTKSIEEAMTQKVILIGNVITSSSFTPEEYQSLNEWIKGGGTLVSPAIKNLSNDAMSIVSDIFGIDATKKFTKDTDRKLINWNEEFFGDKELEYIDEEHERATSIGTVKSFAITPKDCDVLAKFEKGVAAVTRNSVGNGTAYLVGISWRDVIQRNQLNKDQSASREYNNGFEPSSDVWALFLRSIHAKANDISVWKFTVPGGYIQVLVPTHDCDSTTAYDEMHYMSEYEKSLGFSGHYFLTTHYYSDKENFGNSYLSAFYNSKTIPKAQQLIKDGQTVGSHSVCHFPDFNKTDNTDIVTREEYAQRATCKDGVSSGVSTWAEIVLSKQILEEDLGNKVRSFRSGHLCVNKDFHAMLEAGDYSFQSCYAGGDLLSEFPFFGRYDNDWAQDQSKVLTIPLHISDVYSSSKGNPLNDDTWDNHSAVNDWNVVMQKLRGNYASAILLIHPNREWKMTLQKRLVESLDLNEVGMYNFEDYGDFWLSRLNTDYSYEYDEASGLFTITTDTEAVRKSLMTFAVENNGKEIKKIVVSNQDGSVVYGTKVKNLSDNRYLVSVNFSEVLTGVNEISGSGSSLNSVYDINGHMIGSGEKVNNDFLSGLPKGIYILKDSKGTKKIKI